MAFEQKPGYGALFRVKEKEGNGPDYTGSGKTLDGVEFEIAGWKKSDKNGDPYLSLSFKPPRNKAESKPAANPTDDKDVPW